MITTGNQSQSSGLTYLRRKLRAWKICSQFRWEKSGCTYHREEMCNGANVIQSRIKAGKRVGLLKIRMAYGRWYAPQVRRVYSSRSYTVLALVCSVLVHVYSCKPALCIQCKRLFCPFTLLTRIAFQHQLHCLFDCFVCCFAAWVTIIARVALSCIAHVIWSKCCLVVSVKQKCAC